MRESGKGPLVGLLEAKQDRQRAQGRAERRLHGSGAVVVASRNHGAVARETSDHGAHGWRGEVREGRRVHQPAGPKHGGVRAVPGDAVLLT